MKMPTVLILVFVAMMLSPLSSVGQATAPKFSHPKEITNPYLPLSSLKKDILEGTEKGKPLRVERTVKPGSKTVNVNGQDVEAMIVEDREFIRGEIEEVTLDYFVQDDDGTVYYLGEDVDNYKDGKVVSHEGAWLYGKDTHQMGVAMPSHPRVGQKFKSEAVGKITKENNTVVSLTEKVTAPAGKFENCLKVKERNSDGETEEKLYALGVGAVREEYLLLKSHN
jgi:hypothetical protein